MGNCYPALDTTNDDDMAAALADHGGKKSCKGQKEPLKPYLLSLETEAASLTLCECDRPKIIRFHNIPMD